MAGPDLVEALVSVLQDSAAASACLSEQAQNHEANASSRNQALQSAINRLEGQVVGITAAADRLTDAVEARTQLDGERDKRAHEERLHRWGFMTAGWKFLSSGWGAVLLGVLVEAICRAVGMDVTPLQLLAGAGK